MGLSEFSNQYGGLFKMNSDHILWLHNKINVSIYLPTCRYIKKFIHKKSY